MEGDEDEEDLESVEDIVAEAQDSVDLATDDTVEVAADSDSDAEADTDLEAEAGTQLADEVLVLTDVEDDIPVQNLTISGATADPVKDYLKQIGKVALLNAELEVELAKRIEAGLFAEEKLATEKKLSPAEKTRSSLGRKRWPARQEPPA
jgi:RNA polymerase primary sigma factor